MDHRNLIVSILISVAIIFGWDYFYESPRRKALQQQRALEQSLPSAISSENDTITQGNLPVASQQAIENLATSNQQSKNKNRSQSPRISINTPSLSGSIALRGAYIDDVVLKKFRETLDPESLNIVLLKNTLSETPYYANFGWIGDQKNIDLPNADTLWQADGKKLSEKNPITLSWTNRAGVTFEQKFSIDENYLITVTQKIHNNSDKTHILRPYGLISRRGTPKTLGFYILHEGPIAIQNNKLHEINYDKLSKEKHIDFGETSAGWLGITDKYWLVALLPKHEDVVKTGFKAGQTQSSSGTPQPLYQADFLAKPQSIAPRGKNTFESHLFVGAKNVDLLDAYENRYGVERFDLAVDFGWFYFITKPIFYFVTWLFDRLGNFGLAILAMTVLIRLLFFPLAHKSFTSMARMKKLQPEIVKLREAHKGDQRKISAAIMDLYRKHKVNPLSGCFPILLQLPVFFALYKVLFITIEMRHAPFFGWIHDLSAPDPLGLLTVFGLISWNVPVFLSFINIGIWPLIMGGTMWLQQKLNPTPPDPVQQKIFALLPILFTFLLANFPAGLVIYWSWSNMLSIAQQTFIFRQLAIKEKKAAG